MRRRIVVHLAVALTFLPAFVDLPDPISEVRAGPPGGYAEPAPLIVTTPLRFEDLPRSALSDRTAPPSPRPTPVPVDLQATPIPGPTQPPPAEPSTQVSVGGNGPTAQPASLIWPVSGFVSTWHSAAHPAIDIVAACGTPVVAPGAGTVVWAGWKDNGGGMVVDIDLGWGLASLNHLSGVNVARGEWVGQGQIVGWVGATGFATGCHVHAGLFVDGWWQNPIVYLP